MMPSCDQTGTPRHFHSSSTSGSTCLIRARIRASVLPRQSSSSLILASISLDGESAMIESLLMTPESVVLQILSPEDWRLFRALRLEALREAPYAFSTALAGWQGEGDAESRWRARLTDVPLNLVARYEGTPAGMASATAPTNGTSELISMWVAPHARGKGVASALIDAVVSWARAGG